MLGKYIENVTLKVVKNTALLECDVFPLVFERTTRGHL
jgi:hypothetical protein